MNRIIQDENFFIRIIKKAVNEYSQTNDLSKLNVSFKDIDFQITDSINLTDSNDLNVPGLNLSFFNCALSGQRFDITIRELPERLNRIVFEKCEINIDLFINDSKLQALIFNETDITSSHFHISSNEIYWLSFVGSPEKLNQINNILLIGNKNINYLDCRLNQINFLFIDNCSFFEGCTLNGNNIKILQINFSIFKQVFEFLKNKLSSFSLIEKCIFGEVKAKQSNFGIVTEFNNIEFSERVEFTELKSEKSTLKFKNCTFKKTTYFDNSNVLNIEFKSVFFHGITSFQFLNCIQLIKFETSYFEKIGFFEGIKLGNLKSIDTNTIRTIKGQLLKSENKIEYLKYNALDQSKYFQKLSIKDYDYYVLWLNKKSNDFGRNWIKGVKFTLEASLFFFLLLIIINSFISSNYPLTFSNKDSSFAGFSIILLEFLKFTFSLDFKNEEFQSNGVLYFIFIIAKIFIGYGIYQTITAFRKYGKP